MTSGNAGMVNTPTPITGGRSRTSVSILAMPTPSGAG